jgi:hypothetical protein
MLSARLIDYLGENVVQFSLKHDVNGNSHGTSVNSGTYLRVYF